MGLCGSAADEAPTAVRFRVTPRRDATKAPTTESNTGWEFASAYRLGRHWQGLGDYPRARDAYSRALQLEPHHRASLYNLAVTQIRVGDYSDARGTLDALCEADDLPSTATDARGRPWKAALYPIAYHRALIEEYAGNPREAQEWSSPLAKRILAKAPESAARAADTSPETGLPRVWMPALSLHAAILLADHKEDERWLQDAAAAALAQFTAGSPSRAVTTGEVKTFDPVSVMQYVQQAAGRSPRAHYNIACYLARLADLLPSRADALIEAAARETEASLVDRSLLAWAKQDPSLKPARGTSAWDSVIERAEPVTSQRRGDLHTSARNADEGEAREAVAPKNRRERREVVEHAMDLVAYVHPERPDSDVSGALTDLRDRADRLSERAYNMTLADVLARLHDPGTVYRFSDGEAQTVATLPFSLVECLAKDHRRRFVVDTSVGGPPIGAEVTHWNGVRIDRAVDIRASHIAARSLEARRLRAVASLTHRPRGLLAPFSEEDVVVGCRYLEDDADVRVDWEPAARYEARADIPGRGAGLWSIDPLIDAITRIREPGRGMPTTLVRENITVLRIPSFAVARADALANFVQEQLLGLRSAGLVVDLRGNGGGSLVAAELIVQLLAGRSVDPPTFEVRGTEYLRRILAADHDLEKLRPGDALPNAETHAIRVHLAPETDASTSRPDRVLLVVDAGCAGATEFFIARFVDLNLGPVLSSSRRLALIGGVTCDVARPSRHGLRGFPPQPVAASIQVTIARLLRGGRDGRSLQERPVVPDEIYFPTRGDVTGDEEGLFDLAQRMLSKLSERA
jgi:tetratricopeptide (TPR) repeat protein